MSADARNWSYSWACRFPSHKAVLNVLADRFNDKYRCAWPSVPTMAANTGIASRTVQRAVRELEHDGFVIVVPMVRRGTRINVANLYRLPFFTEDAAVIPYPEWEPAARDVTGIMSP